MNVEFKNVEKAIDGRTILNNISLSISSGSIFGSSSLLVGSTSLP